MTDTLKPSLDLDSTLKRVEAEGRNHATVTADKEKVEAEIAHTGESWSVAAAFWRQWDRLWGAKASVTKTW